MNAVEDSPALNAISNVTVNEDSAIQVIALSGISSGAPNENQNLTVSAESSNPALIPHPVISYTSPNAGGTLAFTPSANESGSAVVTIVLSDGVLSVTNTFTVTVQSVEDAPTLAAIGNVTVRQGDGARTVNLSGISSGAGNENQVLVVTASSSDPAIVLHPAVTYVSPGASGSLVFTPVPEREGTAVVSVVVSDGVVSVTNTFVVTVTNVDEPPTLDSIAEITINEDSGVQTLSLTGISCGAANENQTVTIVAVSDTPGLIPNPIVNYTNPLTTGALEFSPVTNQNGSAIIL